MEQLVEQNLQKDLIPIQIDDEKSKYYYNNVETEKDYLCIDDIVIISYYIN